MSAEPVTRQHLDETGASLRGEMRDMSANLRGEMRKDLDDAVANLRGEMQEMESRLRGEIAAVRRELGEGLASLHGEMHEMESRLVKEIGRAMNHGVGVVIEKLGDMVGVVEEKYSDLPGRVAALEALPEEQRRLQAQFDAHQVDFTLHHRPVAPTKRRARAK